MRCPALTSSRPGHTVGSSSLRSVCSSSTSGVRSGSNRSSVPPGELSGNALAVRCSTLDARR
eukprot:763695-Rhodomonas_salina.6